MDTFIGTGEDFINKVLGLNHNKNEYDAFEKKNHSLQLFEFNHLFDNHATFIILHDEDDIIGIMKTQPSMFSTSTHPFQGINYISVKEKYQGYGMAHSIYNILFKTFPFVVGTDYESEDSQRKLEKMSYRLARQNKCFFLTRKAILSYSNNLPKNIDELYKTLHNYY